MTYGMLIDLKKCVGCHACATACKEAHGTRPGVRRSRVVREFEGTYPNVRKTAVPMLCMQCENAPCVEICPTGASQKREDGIVVIDKDVCIGCKSCMNACPYDARQFSEDENGYFGEELNEYEELMYPTMPAGTMDKCTFCADRIDAGNGEMQACVAACPAKARVFGELEELKALAEAKGGYQLLPEEGTNPSVWYIPFNVTEL
ncbi:MAG: 4Fe-4S dicluster domain-containing protein [Adlercreutzia sp.]|nr:4Fe-4S dicluster domain-containing protein [Adlercreutzia sp.]